MLFTRRRMFVSLVVCLLVVQVCWFVFVPSTSVSSMKERLIPSRFVLREDHSENESLPWCDDVVRRSLQRKKSFSLNVSRRVRSFADLEKRWSSLVSFGGYSSPSDCRQRDSSSLALIVCYREREEHLKLFLDHFHGFLLGQHLHYQLFVVNQHGREDFNRGSLFNIGFVQALKIFPFTCFIFHDVDLFPEDQRNLYSCSSSSSSPPRHLSVAIDKFKYKLLYPTLFGGATAFRRDDFLRTNGYANIYWGWGNEDDDMFLRVKQRLNQSTIGRYPLEIGRYQMIQQFGHRTSRRNPHRDRILHSRYSFQLDGLNNLRYRLHQLTFYPLFTLINVSLFQQSFEQISTTFNFTR